MTSTQKLRNAITTLLDAMQPSGDLLPRFNTIRTRLFAELDDSQINEVLGEISTIITQSRSTEMDDRKNWDEFLEQLTGGLRHIEKNLQIARDPEQLQSLLNATRKLSQQVADWRQQWAQQGYQTLTDPLTGIANRAAFEQRLRQEYARWRRYASPLVVQYWCVDDFETLSRNRGRQTGDLALAMVARIFASNLRETDFVARVENEVFALLLPETTLDHAHVVAERLRKKVAGNSFHSRGEPVFLTVSCGYAALQEGDTVTLLMQRIQEALARARVGGGGYSAG